MTIPNMPMVTGEIVELVEAMRVEQIAFDKLVNNRDVHPTQHQVRMAEQRRKAAERQVDMWLASYYAEVKKYAQAFEPKQTNELPGFYQVE